MSNIQLPGGVGLNPNCKLNDPELCRYMDKSIKMAESFNNGFVGVSTTVDVKSGQKTQSTWEIGKDRSHFLTTANGKEQSNIITIGNTTYTKDISDGKWTKFTLSSSRGSSGNSFFNPEQMKNEFKDVLKNTEDRTTYKSLGKESCGAYTCFKYQIIIPEFNETKEYVYFDDKEYIMRKMRIESATSTTETMFEFKQVNIQEPSPIKEETKSGFNTEMLQKLQQGNSSSVNMEQLQKEIEKYQQEQSTSESSEADGE